MQVAIKSAAIALLLACSACHGRTADPTNEAAASNTNMDIETLPPDESDTTPTNELENGVDEPAGNTVDLNSD